MLAIRKIALTRTQGVPALSHAVGEGSIFILDGAPQEHGDYLENRPHPSRD